MNQLKSSTNRHCKLKGCHFMVVILPFRVDGVVLQFPEKKVIILSNFGALVREVLLQGVMLLFSWSWMHLGVFLEVVNSNMFFGN